MVAPISGKFKFQVEIKDRYVIVGNQTTSTFTEKEYTHCIDKFRKKYCVPFIEIKNSEVGEMCEVQLVTNSSKISCKYVKIPMYDISFVKLRHVYFLSGAPTETIAVECGGEASLRKLPSSGFTTVPDNCSLRSDRYRLHGLHYETQNETLRISPERWGHTKLTNPLTLQRLDRLLQIPVENRTHLIPIPQRHHHFFLTLTTSMGVLFLVMFLGGRHLKRRCGEGGIRVYFRRYENRAPTTDIATSGDPEESHHESSVEEDDGRSPTVIAVVTA